MVSIRPQAKLASRCVSILTLVLVLVLSTMEASVHALEHQHHELIKDCSLCLVGTQLESAVAPSNPLARPMSLAADIAPRCGSKM